MTWYECVALLAEGVDRNINGMKTAKFSGVALLAEGVDRNPAAAVEAAAAAASPSSRRAWIEIGAAHHQRTAFQRRPPRGGRG